MEDNPVYLTRFAAKNINVLSQIFEEGNLKPWDDLKLEYTLTTDAYFLWLQQKHAIPHKLKTMIKQNPANDSNVLIQDYHLIKGALILTLEKLSILITKFTNKPSSNVYFQKIEFENKFQLEKNLYFTWL